MVWQPKRLSMVMVVAIRKFSFINRRGHVGLSIWNLGAGCADRRGAQPFSCGSDIYLSKKLDTRTQSNFAAKNRCPSLPRFVPKRSNPMVTGSQRNPGAFDR
jgi:hypothetical protein